MPRLVNMIYFSPVALIMFLPIYAPAIGASSAELEHTTPQAIDRAVEAFTGSKIGETGGARMAADPRLKLAECASPLQTSWHGENKTMVQIECAGPAPWRIFVALRSKSKVPVSKATAPLVKRGDPVTVLVRGRGFSVQQAGEAMESGRAGDWIGIRTARETKPVRARIESPGLAVIPAT